MANNTFHLEIVTPRRVAFKGEVENVSVPGVVGGFQVLYSHAPLLSSLEIGELKFTEANGTECHYATSGGFAEVRDNKVVLLVETAERTDEIDKERAKTARDRAKTRIKERKPKTDFQRAQFALKRALNRLKIAGIQ